MRKHLFLQGSGKGRGGGITKQMDPEPWKYGLRISPGDDSRSKEDVKCPSMKCKDFPFKLTVNLWGTIPKRAEKGNLYGPEHSARLGFNCEDEWEFLNSSQGAFSTSRKHWDSGVESRLRRLAWFLSSGPS